MEYKEIKKLMDDMGESKLDSLEIEFPDGVKISMTKNSHKEEVLQNVIQGSAPMTVPVVIQNSENSLATQSAENSLPVSAEEKYKEIKSPMVGTFYQASSPNAKPYVNVGDIVHVGQVVCVVEAMKLMNEIESEYDGEVVEVCVKNEDMVEFGTTLIKIK
jgi:acetyl-CoA carboxylase biotin carboxyl carrier protein